MAKSTHRIDEISYSKNYLACICGWEGSANDEAAYALHRKEAPPIADIMAPTRTVYNRPIVRRAKVEVS